MQCKAVNCGMVTGGKYYVYVGSIIMTNLNKSVVLGDKDLKGKIRASLQLSLFPMAWML